MTAAAGTVYSSRLSVQDDISHPDCPAFLFYEAELLDNNMLVEWLNECLDPAISYQIPIRVTRERGAGSAFSSSGWHMNETWESIATRVRRLDSTFAWAEDPPSRTRRFVSNIRVSPSEDHELIDVRSNLLLFRGRHESTTNDLISAERHDVLRLTGNGLRLSHRLVLLDHTTVGVPALSIFL